MTRTIDTSVHRNVGHPWTQEPGFDVMYVKAVSEMAIDRAIDEACDKHWALFCAGTLDDTAWRAVFYKPHGKQCEWLDPAP